MTLRSALLYAAAATLSLLVGSACSRPDARHNVVLVTLDTTRPDFFGSWGAAGDLTPRMDALAADGARFSTAISASAVTPVSHASILTGQPPYKHGLRILAGPSGFRLPVEVPTLATTLAEAGYKTAAYHSAFPVSAIYGFDRNFDIFEDMSNVGFQAKDGGSQGWDVAKGQRRSDTTTNMVLEFLESTEEPFFLWIHYWDPHDLVLLPDGEFMQANQPEHPKETVAWWRELYGIEISYVDREFGRVIDALKQSGRYDQTVIAIIADHGEGLDDGEARHGWRAHRILYQEQVHVPLIIRAPNGPRGVVVDEMVRSIDVFPTLLDFVGVELLAAVDGRSLRPLMEGVSAEVAIAYADQINLWDSNAGMVARRPKADFLHMAMDDQYKLIYRPSYPEDSELYDYRADPGEQRDLFHEQQFAEQRVRLLQELATREGWVLEPFLPVEGGGMSQRDIELLAAIGYADGEGSPGEALWEWICPVEWTRHASRGACPDCSQPMLPVGKQQPPGGKQE